MSKKKRRKRESQAPKLEDIAAGEAATHAGNRNIRETVESVAIAFILAFLFRTFEAEAFVIPTGSMAPTLQGRHKDIECPKCDHRYRASASAEVDANDNNLPFMGDGRPENDRIATEVVQTTCPLCRYPLSVDPRPGPSAQQDPLAAAGAQLPSYNGDRIIVGKFNYEFADPERWDVIVFKFPGNANMNYIKRLVGLPNEDIRIYHGDVFIRDNSKSSTGENWSIERKPPDKALVMRQIVYDSAHVPVELHKAGWPLQVRPETSGGPADENGGQNGWQHSIEENGLTIDQSFHFAGDSDAESWLRYRHIVPDEADWQAVRTGQTFPADGPQPQLISDFYAFNTSVIRRYARNNTGRSAALQRGLHWVGDLMVEADVTIEKNAGWLTLDLVEAGVHFQCQVDLANGKVKFSHGAGEATAGTIDSPLGRPGRYQLTFGNVDDQLLLWVDGDLVAAVPYASPGKNRPQSTPEDPGDLAPVGIAAKQAQVTVRGVRVYRDIYYIADSANGRPSSDIITDYPRRTALFGDLSPTTLRQFLSSPSEWEMFTQRNAVTFTTGADQFFVLGDNSPASKDSRLWSDDPVRPPPHVPREMLIGKAIWIYWPHSWDEVPGSDIPFPFFPNFSDMGLVR